MKSALLALAGCLALGTAQAAAPLAIGLDAGYSFSAYAGPAPVGQGDVDEPYTLFYIDEQVAAGYKSWYVFFDPGPLTQDLQVTLRFEQPIAAVLTTRAELDASNAAYGAAGITYGSSRHMGLETCPIGRVYCDAVGWIPGSHELVLDWSAVHPGDHIRVLVAVPEPPNLLLFGAGLAALALTLRRRRGA